MKYPRTIKVGIYTLARAADGVPAYVGQAGRYGGCRARLEEHWRGAEAGVQTALYHGLRKHGRAGIVARVVWERTVVLTSPKEAERWKRRLDAWEQLLIRWLGTFRRHNKRGWNLNLGGAGQLGFRFEGEALVRQRERGREANRVHAARGWPQLSRGRATQAADGWSKAKAALAKVDASAAGKKSRQGIAAKSQAARQAAGVTHLSTKRAQSVLARAEAARLGFTGKPTWRENYKDMMTWKKATGQAGRALNTALTMAPPLEQKGDEART